MSLRPTLRPFDPIVCEPPSRLKPRTALLSEDEDRRLRKAFAQSISTAPNLQPQLRGALIDSLEHPGSLVRARLAFALLQRQQVEPELGLDLAIGLEYFHTASLLFDDLPAMDDARERRGRPCPHVVYGESAAMLAALALINRGYALIWRVIADIPANRRQRAAELVEACLGIDGVLNGQARDLFFAQGPRDGREVLEIAEGKTVSLIRLTLVLPALVANVNEPQLQALSELSRVWGLAYQILDDFKDQLMSEAQSGKSSHRDAHLGRPSFPLATGPLRAWNHLRILLDSATGLLADSALTGPEWQPLAPVQALLEEDYRELRRLSVEAA